jgi:Protein of unknown function (DUF732)
MAHCRFHSGLIRAITATAIAVCAMAGAVGVQLPTARADAVAYLVNVTVRPGYNFVNADAALAYGDGICRWIAQGWPYGEVMDHVKADFGTADEYQASYLITQAANELCPQLISQLRSSAAGYRPPAL